MILCNHLSRTYALIFSILVAALGSAPAVAQEPTTEPTKTVATPSSSDPPVTESSAVKSKPDTPEPREPPGGKRVFGVLPNYRTVNENEVNGPMTTRQKFTIASKDSFDYPLVFLAAGLAGVGQLSDQNPSFGQGLKGYSKRLVSAYGDQAIGNILTEGVFPALLHEDPRYYRRGTGSRWSRIGYAASRVLVTHRDSGGTRFNYSEWIGNATGTAISNAYYPDQRTVGDNVTKLIEQCGIDAFSQVLKEFWPDVHKLLQRRNATAADH